jgi:2-octaprenyl-6-methoxyphenol hydroxylase
MVHQRVVLIGNAMHQIHPVAGQGFNLGLRDAAVLADRLLTQHRLGKDLGDPDFLHHYARARQEDLKTVIRFTDGLVKVFSNTFPPLVALRNLALVALDRLPPAKRLLTRRAMGYGIRLS